MWQIAYLKILVIWALGYTPSELDDTRNLTYNEQLTCFFSLCEQHYELNLMFTLYRQYTYNYLALQILQRYNQNFFDQTHAPSTCRQNAIMGNNALDPSAIPSTSSGLGATPSISAPSAFPSSAASFNTLIAPGAASSSTAALYTPVASVYGSKMSRKRKRHKCSECNYETDFTTSLVRHKRTHTGKKPFKCTQCDYAAAQQNSLNDHLRTHTDERAFPCPHESCDYKAKTASNLWAHKKRRHKHDQKQER